MNCLSALIHLVVFKWDKRTFILCPGGSVGLRSEERRRWREKRKWGGSVSSKYRVSTALNISLALHQKWRKWESGGGKERFERGGEGRMEDKRGLSPTETSTKGEDDRNRRQIKRLNEKWREAEGTWKLFLLLFIQNYELFLKQLEREEFSSSSHFSLMTF